MRFDKLTISPLGILWTKLKKINITVFQNPKKCDTIIKKRLFLHFGGQYVSVIGCF